MRRLETIKEKIYRELLFIFLITLCLLILAVVGRCGPHLMIVMIFVTQNNFLNCPGISDRLLVFNRRKKKEKKEKEKKEDKHRHEH